MPKTPKAETVKFMVPPGTRALYSRAAELSGQSLREWCREALREALETQLAAHDIEPPTRRQLPIHPTLRRRLQPKIRIPPDEAPP